MRRSHPTKFRERMLKRNVRAEMHRKRKAGVTQRPVDEDPQAGEEAPSSEEPERHGYDERDLNFTDSEDRSPAEPMRPGEDVVMEETGDASHDVNDQPEEDRDEQNAQDADMSMFTIAESDEESAEVPIRGIRPTKAIHRQNCKLCTQEIHIGSPIIKLQKIGWVHSECCRQAIQNGDQIRLDRGAAYYRSRNQGPTSREKREVELCEATPVENEENKEEETEISWSKVGTGVCVLTMAMVMGAISMAETPNVQAAAELKDEVTTTMSTASVETFLAEVKEETHVSSLCKLTYATVGAGALYLGQYLWNQVQIRTRLKLKKPEVEGFPAPRCGQRCVIGSWTQYPCVNGCRRARHHRGNCYCLQEDCPYHPGQPDADDSDVRAARNISRYMQGRPQIDSSSDEEWSAVDEDETLDMIEEDVPEEDVNALSAGSYPGWTCFNYDTGAAISVFPKSKLPKHVTDHLKSNGKRYRSACGRSVPDEGGIQIVAGGEDSTTRKLRTRVAEVHKPLVSASGCSDHLCSWIGRKGHNENFLVPAQGKTAKYIAKVLKRASTDPQEQIMNLYEEGGTYNFYLNTDQGEISSLSLQEEASKLTRAQLEEAYARGPRGPH